MYPIHSWAVGFFASNCLLLLYCSFFLFYKCKVAATREIKRINPQQHGTLILSVNRVTKIRFFFFLGVWNKAKHTEHRNLKITARFPTTRNPWIEIQKRVRQTLDTIERAQERQEFSLAATTSFAYTPERRPLPNWGAEVFFLSLSLPPLCGR